MIHINTIDWVIVIVYFILMMGFGSYYGKFVKTSKDFFFGGQRFAWWIIAFSCVATLVGSYSFVKYSANAYSNGFSSSMSYLNDWMWLPLLMFGWIPIIYYSKIKSIPEYFEKRFDSRTRLMLTVFMLLYLIGYIGINLYTMGVVLNPILHVFADSDVNFYFIVTVIAVVSAVYITAGGQTSVIMTDLLQGVLLLVAGIAIFTLGVAYLGGFGEFWSNVPAGHKFALARYNDSASFSFVGVFWQDGIANSAVFWFMNQGIIMRFLSVRSVADGRKTILFVILILCPIATFAIDSTGWLGTAMVNKGVLAPDVSSQDIFIHVAYLVCRPGIFGLILAALTAALMSTVDTLINASAAIWVNDVWQPYVKPGKSDGYYLGVARWVSVIAMLVGIVLVPVYKSVGSIYQAHGIFTATITPPMAVALMMAMMWKRYSSKAAFWTLLGGALMMFLGMIWPQYLIQPFSHGIPLSGGMFKGYKYIRALYGVVCSLGIGVIVTLITRPKDAAEIAGLTFSTQSVLMKLFKGTEGNLKKGSIVHLKVSSSELVPSGGEEEGMALVLLSGPAMKKLAALAGDVVYVCDTRWWYGGLRSLHTRAMAPSDELNEDAIYMTPRALELAGFKEGQEVTAEKLL
ncbi:MAG TPA: sodium:solute symporter family protein [bacterium]|nr:sodium:solute symporter family protein [bacterium]